MFVQLRFISCLCLKHVRLLDFFFLLCFLCFLLWFSRFKVLGVYACASSMHAYVYLQYAYAYSWDVHTCPMYAHAYSCPKTLNLLYVFFPLFYSYVWPLFYLVFIAVYIYVYLVLFSFIFFNSFMLIKVSFCLDEITCLSRSIQRCLCLC